MNASKQSQDGKKACMGFCQDSAAGVLIESLGVS